jgi:hypothetical protein
MRSKIPKGKYCLLCDWLAYNPNQDSTNYCEKFEVRVRKAKKDKDMWHFKRCSACLKRGVK